MLPLKVRDVFCLALSGLAACNTVTVTRVMTPAEAREYRQIVVRAVEQDHHWRSVRETQLVVYADDLWIVSDGERVPIGPDDRIRADVTLDVGDKVPGGGVVRRGIEPGFVVFGSLLTTAGVGAAVFGFASAATVDKSQLLSDVAIGVYTLIAAVGIVAAGLGAPVLIEGFRHPRVER